MKYKNYIFDLYGTLIDINTNEWSAQLWKKMAILYGYYGQHHLGRLVRRLLEEGADSPQRAKTLAETGFAKPTYLRALRAGGILDKYLSASEALPEKRSRADISAAHYYIKEENKAVAAKRFKKMRGGFPMLFVWFAVCTAACFFLLYFLPDVLQLIDNAFGMI